MVSIFQVDAFADMPFSGNPAAVCILSGADEESWMQKVAREMNVNTAFNMILFPDFSHRASGSMKTRLQVRRIAVLVHSGKSSSGKMSL